MGMPLKDTRNPAASSRVAFLEEQQYTRKAQLLDDALMNVNQALGRALRSANDFCVFVLCDERYSSQAIRHRLTAVPQRVVPRAPKTADAEQIGYLVAKHLAQLAPRQTHSPDLM